VLVPSPPVLLPDNPPRWALDAGQEARKETRDDGAFAAALDRALVPCPSARARHAEIPKLAPEKRLWTYVHVATAVENCRSADMRAAETLLLLRFSPLYTERFLEVNFVEGGRKLPVVPSRTLGELVKEIAQLPSDVRFHGVTLEPRKP